MLDAVTRFGRLGIALIFGSVAVWALILILIPHITLISYAFHANPGAIAKGLASEGWSIASFLPLFDPEDTLALRTFLRTMLTSGAITVLALVVCYPIAFYLAKVATSKSLNLLMLCLLVPFWINEVLRAYAWRSLMARLGLLNQLTSYLGLGTVDYFNYEIPILNANIALFVGLIYSYVLFMIFPMFNAMESLDSNQIEAARDLGASWLRVHRKVVIPMPSPASPRAASSPSCSPPVPISYRCCSAGVPASGSPRRSNPSSRCSTGTAAPPMPSCSSSSASSS